MKKTQRKLKLESQTVRQLDDQSLTDARGGSGTHVNCGTNGIIMILPNTNRPREAL
jgi:hypothetical protein